MNYKPYATKYFNLGLNISCLSYIKTKYNINNPAKASCTQWADLQIRRQQADEIENMPWGFSTGLGCVIGSSSIKCIDIDNCNDQAVVDLLLKIFSLPKNYEWVVKTPNGFHIYIRSDNLLLSHKVLNNGILTLLPNEVFCNKFKQIELRWAGHCVLPPTINYSFLNNNDFPKEKPLFVRSVLVFEFMCHVAGNSKIDLSSNSIVKAELQIDNYFIKIGYSSEFPKELEIYENNELIIEQINVEGWQPNYKKRQYRYNIYLDVETTGLINDPTDYNNYPRLIQLSYLTENGKGDNLTEFYIRPDNFIIPNNITELTGITNDFANRNGVDIKKALTILDFSCYPSTIVCHNADFDLSILDAEYFKLGQSNLLRNLPVFCTMKHMAEICNSKYPKLSELYEFLFKEVVSTKIHNATDDVKILRDCYRIMDLYGYTR